MISTYKELNISLMNMFKICSDHMIIFMLIYVSELLY